MFKSGEVHGTHGKRANEVTVRRIVPRFVGETIEVAFTVGFDEQKEGIKRPVEKMGKELQLTLLSWSCKTNLDMPRGYVVHIYFVVGQPSTKSCRKYVLYHSNYYNCGFC